MEFNAQRVDDANAVISAKIEKDTIESQVDKLAKQAANLL